MQLINTPIRKNLLVGLAVGTGTLVSGCGTPEPASLENANRGDVDFSKLDYSKLDYGQVEMNVMCSAADIDGKDLGTEMVSRLNHAITLAQEKKLDKAVITTLVTERNSVIAGNNVFQQYADQLSW